MTTNKHTATRTTKSGNTIEVTVERGTWDEKVSLDGWETGTVKTHLVNRTTIAIKGGNKVLVTGRELSTKFSPGSDYAKKGCVARLSNVGLGQAAYDLILSAIAEAEAAVPKTARQIEIETAEAKRNADYAAWEKSPEGIEDRNAWERHENLMYEMNRADSDY